MMNHDYFDTVFLKILKKRGFPNWIVTFQPILYIFCISFLFTALTVPAVLLAMELFLKQRDYTTSELLDRVSFLTFSLCESANTHSLICLRSVRTRNIEGN